MKDVYGSEMAPKLERRMGTVAQEHKVAAEIPVPAQVLGTGAPISSGTMLDFSDFGGPKDKKDTDAETPATKPFPKQGAPVKQEGEHFIFRGFGGVPFRCKTQVPPEIKAKDPRQPVVTADVCVRLFDLSKPEDIKDYAMVWDHAAKGFFTAPTEERQWVAEKQTWYVFVRWGVKYWELPDE
jgi:hypothetical protein